MEINCGRQFKKKLLLDLKQRETKNVAWATHCEDGNRMGCLWLHALSLRENEYQENEREWKQLLRRGAIFVLS